MKHKVEFVIEVEYDTDDIPNYPSSVGNETDYVDSRTAVQKMAEFDLSNDAAFTLLETGADVKVRVL